MIKIFNWKVQNFVFFISTEFFEDVLLLNFFPVFETYFYALFTLI